MLEDFKADRDPAVNLQAAINDLEHGRIDPELADNIWHAQMAGHPRILAAGNAIVGISRSAALRGIPRTLSRDEYPFAFTREGGGSSWIGHIQLAQQWAQGGIISSFIRKHPIRPGDRFIVVVVNRLCICK